ncbi:MAG: DUF2085 domain-containing protein [Acidobacteria bacterium]|nr:MAG: DUF2085 domain-containing protein [Acidobacteriota bacterium]
MRRVSLSSLAWVALLTAVVGWAALVPLAALLGQGVVGGRVGAMIAAGAYVSGGLVCHQRPERSFHLAGAQLPVCGRCTGLYLSTAAGVLLALTRRRAVRETIRGRETLLHPYRSWLLAAAVPSLATLALEWSGAWPGSNSARAAAAAPLGLVLGWLLVEAAGFRGRL